MEVVHDPVQSSQSMVDLVGGLRWTIIQHTRTVLGYDIPSHIGSTVAREVVICNPTNPPIYYDSTQTSLQLGTKKLVTGIARSLGTICRSLGSVLDRGQDLYLTTSSIPGSSLIDSTELRHS